MSKTWGKDTGVDPKKAEEAQKGVNKSGTENMKQAWNNIKDVFSGNTSRANTPKQNEKRSNSGGYYKK